jgi:transcriptional regulator GlxA family with amidase domain
MNPLSGSVHRSTIDLFADIRNDPAMARRHTVATVICDGATPFEFAVAAEVFGIDRSDLGVPWYRFLMCSATGAPVAAHGGITVIAPDSLADAERADTIIVAPTRSRDFPPEYLDFLVRAHQRGARLVSLCSGAFILAAAGLLDGRRASTHWMNAEELVCAHPDIDIDSGVLYIDDGDILTSAGTAASIDLCLHLVRCDFGAEVANAVARRMVVPPHRDGGQAQYVDHPIDVLPGSELFAETLLWAEANLAEPLTIDDLAARAAMSPRTFARRFTATTGTSPHQWLIRQRVQLAQRLLESTDASVERIATDCGFGTATNLRTHFQRIVKTTPTRYRRCFGAPVAAATS